MRVKHLIRELQKCDPEGDVIMRTPNRWDTAYRLIRCNSRVFIESSSYLGPTGRRTLTMEDLLTGDYHSMDDTPYPLSEVDTREDDI